MLSTAARLFNIIAFSLCPQVMLSALLQLQLLHHLPVIEVDDALGVGGVAL